MANPQREKQQVVRINESRYCLGIIAGFSVWLIVVAVGFNMTSGVCLIRSLIVRIFRNIVSTKQTIKAQAQGFLLIYIGFICVNV